MVEATTKAAGLGSPQGASTHPNAKEMQIVCKPVHTNAQAPWEFPNTVNLNSSHWDLPQCVVIYIVLRSWGFVFECLARLAMGGVSFRAQRSAPDSRFE